MYENFFGLAERPFDLTSNPKYLFLTPSHREALSSLEYGISTRTGITVLVGEAGTGKTTLIRATLDAQEHRNTRAVYMNNPTLSRSEFLEFLAQSFGLVSSAAASKTTLLRELQEALVAFQRTGVTPALIFDEAQSLPYELLEEIRLLANIESPTDKLLPIVLAGQPELAERLNHPSLRQLKQRIGLRCQLKQLTLTETSAYITARVAVAGGNAATMFTREAVMAIQEHSQGIPRTISVICHNSLISGYALRQRPITAEVVREVCDDFDLSGGASSPSPIPHRAGGVTEPRTPPAPAQDALSNESRDMFSSLARSRRRSLFFSRT